MCRMRIGIDVCYDRGRVSLLGENVPDRWGSLIEAVSTLFLYPLSLEYVLYLTVLFAVYLL